MKFAPVTVSVKPALPAVVEAGDSAPTIGAGLGAAVIANGKPADVPPPGEGVRTVTCAVPTAATSPAPIVARSCVALTYVVARALPFHRTTDDDTKLVPLTVSVTPAPPAVVEAGDSVPSVGAGLVIAAKVALTLTFAFGVTVQVAVPVQAPLQPENVDPLAGAAVSVTGAPVGNRPEHVVPQLIPAGLLFTVPLPVRVTVTVAVEAPAPLPLRPRETLSPSALSVTFAATSPVAVGWNRTTTADVLPGDTLKLAPDTTLNGFGAVAVPVSVVLPTFCTVKVRSTAPPRRTPRYDIRRPGTVFRCTRDSSRGRSVACRPRSSWALSRSRRACPRQRGRRRATAPPRAEHRATHRVDSGLASPC